VGKWLHISHLLKIVHQDAQTRLSFTAQAVIPSKIRHYVPKAEDPAWPNILICEFLPNIRICALTDSHRHSCEQASSWDGNQGEGKHETIFQKRVCTRT